MKKITLGFSILAATAIFLTSCNKKTAEAPVADTEFDSAIQASFANTTVTDVDMICGFLGENQIPKFVANQAGSPATVVTNTPGLAASITWAPGTKCMDGKTRSGSIVMTWTNPTTYYRDYQFAGTVYLNNYVVDGWSVDDVTPFKITNLAPVSGYTSFKWSLAGTFSLSNVADPTKTITWDGKLTKTLTNAAQMSPVPNATSAITWTIASNQYDGSFKGVTVGDVAYTYTIGTTDAASAVVKNPLVRNYTCSPDKVIGITTTPSVAAVNSEYHPFINGTASFTTSTKAVRTIDFGTEGSPCDNSGTVTIKGITYNIDFMK